MNRVIDAQRYQMLWAMQPLKCCMCKKALTLETLVYVDYTAKQGHFTTLYAVEIYCELCSHWEIP